MSILHHGGDIDAAERRFGRPAGGWIDLSTGINRQPYPIPPLSPAAWQMLPTQRDRQRLCDAAARYYGARSQVIATSGAQSVIQALPSLCQGRRMKIVGPTYGEYEACFRRAGWEVETVGSIRALEGGDVGIVVNPNNPDGRNWSHDDLKACAETVSFLVIDESFADTDPDLSVLGTELEARVLVLRSFGKFFGLAGVRLGFAMGEERLIQALHTQFGPWPVSGPAIEIAIAAFSDADWTLRTRRELDLRSAALRDALKLPVLGGTSLFTLCETPDAALFQDSLAKVGIWTRRFHWSSRLVRIGTWSDEDRENGVLRSVQQAN